MSPHVSAALPCPTFSLSFIPSSPLVRSGRAFPRTTSSNSKRTVWTCRKGKPKSSNGGRGRSAKRTALYDAMRVYRDHFTPLLEAELAAEQDAVLNARALDRRSGYVLRGLVVRKQGRLYSNMVYKLRARKGVLGGEHRFGKGDLIQLTVEEGMEVEEGGGVVEGTVLGRGFGEISIAVGIGTEGADRMERIVEGRMLIRAECGTNALAFERARKAVEGVADVEGGAGELGKLLVMSLNGMEQRDREEEESGGDLFVGGRGERGEVDRDLFEGGGRGESEEGEKWDGAAKETVSRVSTSEMDRVLKRMNGGLNGRQEGAVTASLRRRVTLIQGPPGTGKTVTAAHLIVCAIRLGLGPILACAASNVAADNLLRKVVEVAGRGSVLQVVRIGRVPAIDEDVWDRTLESMLENNKVLERARDACAKGEMKIAELISMEKKIAGKIIGAADIVVGTCVGCGRAELEEHKFPFVVVDEATQATEPDVLIPLSVTFGKDVECQLVLVGDHCQLPPTTLSRVQSDVLGIGLETSMFLRLWRQGVLCDMLNVQYRMHPDIAGFPAKHFYSGKLQNGITADDRLLPESKEPPWKSRVIFCNVGYGREESDQSAYDGIDRVRSFFNRAESRVVLEIVQKLERQQHFTASDIGVISPYAGQVKLLKDSLLGLDGEQKIEISTVDGFQGREKNVIILSAVRNNDRREVGFLRDWRRLNVAITRARVLLIVVGNENTLASDFNWRSWLKWVKRNGVKETVSPGEGKTQKISASVEGAES